MAVVNLEHSRTTGSGWIVGQTSRVGPTGFGQVAGLIRFSKSFESTPADQALKTAPRRTRNAASRFHENACWACTLEPGVAELLQHPVTESLPEWTGEDLTKDWKHRILAVTQAGDVASLLLEMHSASYPTEAWVDIHALLRIEGVWKDMNKTATHADRAAWAGRR